jgi:hypothetical protein
MPAEMSAKAYGYKNEKGNQAVYKVLVRYIGMSDRTPTLEQPMEHLAASDMSLNISQSPSSSKVNTITTTKALARKMDSQKRDTTGLAKDDGLTSDIYGQESHIFHNLPD